jgi:hypothetical protein
MESRGYETCYRNGCISGDWLPVFWRIRRERDQKDVAKMNLTKVGSITTSRTTSPMDARRDLSKKADELGGKYFVVIAGQKNEKTVHANADVYK